MCSRLLTLSKRCCSRRVTVVMRNSSQLGQDVLEAHDARPAVEPDDVQVDAIVALEVGGGEEVVHHLHHVDPVRARHDDEARGVLMVGLVADVFHHGKLLRANLLRHLLLHFAAGHLVWQRGDDGVAVFDLIRRARLEAADALVVNLHEVGARGDDLCARRQIRALHELQELARGGFRLFKQVNAGVRHFAQVVRRDIGGHADGDAGGAVQQQVRQTRRQNHRLFERAVEVRLPVHRAVRQLGEQHFGVPGELRFGVAHGRERLRVILRAPVALAVDDGVAIGERLRHQHHRLVARAVAVRMEFADDVADGARGFLVLVARRQGELAHRVDDAALDGLQPVAERGQRAVEDDVHRVVEVRLLGEDAKRLLLDAFEIQFLLVHLFVTPAHRQGCPSLRATRGGRTHASWRAACP